MTTQQEGNKMTSEPITIITHDLLRSWSPCQDGYRRFCELFPSGADLKTAMNGLIADGHDDWSYWLFCKCRDNKMFLDIVSAGYRNSGNWNSGDWNSGNWNSGNWNSGYRNSGNWNSGNRNSGYRNSGNRNSGDWNSGDRNSGYRNSGNRNSGNWNSGDRNSGNWNSGDWNSGNRNSGFFNTDTPQTVRVFGKDCPRDVWESAPKPDFLFFDLTYWVDESEMTEAEKAADPHFYVRGGQLRKRDYKEAFKLSWENADKENRELIRKLPNFDADIFYKISGIDLRDKK